MTGKFAINKELIEIELKPPEPERDEVGCMKADCGKDLTWHNCYSGTYDLIHPDSYSHPAKMSPALCFRIFSHLKELGLLKDTDTILDPMGGTGLTAICAGAQGLSAITVELEEKFVNFQKQNKEYASAKLFKPLDWTILQGDARRLSELVGNGNKAIMSPPYDNRMPSTSSNIENIRRPHHREDYYGKTTGQIGNLKSITSPPYEDMEKRDRSTDSSYREDREITHAGGSVKLMKGYQAAADNIGQQDSQSYLEAMAAVYSEIAKVSNVLVVVVKNPTRNKKLRRFDLDTISIMKEAGWDIHCQHRALLFEELEQADIFNGSQKKVKGRMSFFKRLSWQNGSPVASWEDIIIAVCGDCPFEGKFTDEECHSCQQQLEGVANAQVRKLEKLGYYRGLHKVLEG